VTKSTPIFQGITLLKKNRNLFQIKEYSYRLERISLSKEMINGNLVHYHIRARLKALNLTKETKKFFETNPGRQKAY